MKAVIMHLDMDAFFASVEELADPGLRGRPIAVAGQGDRTIITTASYAARRYGVRTGMTVRQARLLCRDLLVLKGDYRKYANASRIVMDVLSSFTPDVLPLSVDEALMDVTDIPGVAGAPEALGRAVKKAVLGASGLTCSVGMAPTRVLAKLASGEEKPDGLTVLRPGAEVELLERTPVERICGIGPKTAEILRQMGINTCGLLGRYPLELLEKRFGSFGLTLSRMGRGEDAPGTYLGRAGDEGVRSIGHSLTLPRDLTDPGSMFRVLLTLSEMVGRRARAHGCAGNRLTLTWRYRDFSTHTRQITLPHPVRLTSEIAGHASSILSALRLSKPVRLLGISLSGLSFDGRTGSLFGDDIRREKVQEALDRVNDRFGEFSVWVADSLPALNAGKVISPSWRSRGIRNSF